MHKMRTWAVVGTRGVPGAYGGFETFADQFAQTLDSEKVELEIFCDKTIARDSQYSACRRRFLPLSANGAIGVIYDFLSIAICVFTRSDVLLLGCSGGLAVPLARVFGLKVVTNIAGIEWGRAKWGRLAQKFLKFSEAVAVRFSNAVVADNRGIAEYIDSAYAVSSSIIAYGGDHLEVGSAEDPLAIDGLPWEWTEIAPRSFLAIARCQPDNNIEPILEAFRDSNAQLLFISNWEVSDFGANIRKSYASHDNIVLLNPVYDNAHLSFLRRNCIAYVHGHSAGGTNPSLVEAMWFRKNCLCFDNVFNRYTTAGHGLFWHSADDLRRLLALDFDDPDLQRKAIQLGELAETDYCWSVIVEKYTSLLEAI